MTDQRLSEQEEQSIREYAAKYYSASLLETRKLLAEIDRLRGAIEIARQLPFCDGAGCEGGQHPARNCFGCEALWNRWREALAACTPTKSAP